MIMTHMLFCILTAYRMSTSRYAEGGGDFSRGGPRGYNQHDDRFGGDRGVGNGYNDRSCDRGGGYGGGVGGVYDRGGHGRDGNRFDRGGYDDSRSYGGRGDDRGGGGRAYHAGGYDGHDDRGARDRRGYDDGGGRRGSHGGRSRGGGRYNEEEERAKDDAERTQGFVASLKENFGFIKHAESESEFFFHYSELRGDADVRDLQRGTEVEFGGYYDARTDKTMAGIAWIPKHQIQP
jgi:cold shock CspA family protein